MVFPIYSKINQTEVNHPTAGKTPLFDFEKGEFVLIDGKTQNVADKEGLKIWVEKMLLTVKDKYEIYLQDNKPYGIPRLNMSDRTYPKELLYADIEQEIRDALLENNEVKDSDNYKFEQKGRTLLIKFTVYSNYGEDEEVVEWII